ncbi:MAG: glycoside hydrolase family 97 protein [Bacteroidales bacterium]
MKKLVISSLAAFSLLLGCTQKPESGAGIYSPDKKLALDVFLDQKEGTVGYMLKKGNTVIIDSSFLGFEFTDTTSLENHLKWVGSDTLSFSETWQMPWGEQRNVNNTYRQLTVNLEESKAPFRKFALVFRVFNDGLGFRYSFPLQNGLTEALIKEENTEFKLTGDYQCWWQPGDWDIYEHLYNDTKFSQIDALAKRNHPNLAQTYIPFNAVNTPMTMKMNDSLYIAFHEAELVDYSDMTLGINKTELMMKSILVGSERTPYKVKRSFPFDTPWRVIMVGEKATDLLASNMVVNLNEPNKLGDISWFKPTKYVGIWWGMHLGTMSWDMASGKHGATTANAKKYIDFAAENNIHGILVEGWNTGWEHWIGFEDREGVFDFVTAYPDYDLPEVVNYGKQKGVELIMHHETSAAINTYEQQMDTAFQLMQKYGIHAVKTGYVGKIIPKGEYHHGQWMVNHYFKPVIAGAKYQVAVNAHEPIKDTGLRRTYPNFVSREGLRGQEFNAWATDGGNPPSHLPTIAFTRMLAGPIDYTPGIFRIKLDPYKPDNQVNTTLAQQLALYVVIYSPLQMVADLPEHYKGNPAFQFIRDVAVDWEQSEYLNGEPGQFVTIARQERGSDNWFLGAITNETERNIDIDLSFLTPGKKYNAVIYEDAPNAHWNENPTAIEIRTMPVDSSTKWQQRLAPGGGCAVSIMPVE